MLKLNIPQLVTAVQNAEAFTLPKMNKGTKYLHRKVFCNLLTGHGVFLSDLNFNAFTADDIRTLSDMYEEIIGKNQHEANGIANTLRTIDPVCKATAYV